jgi:hypothetical protein
MNIESRIVAIGSFPSSKENLRRETIKFKHTERLIKRIRRLIKKGK